MKLPGLVVSLALAGLLCVPAVWAADDPLKAIVILLDDNHARIAELAEKHVGVIIKTRFDLTKGVPVSYDPAKHEIAFFAAEGLSLGRRCYGQMAVIRKLAAEANLDAMTLEAVNEVIKRQQAYLDRAVRSADHDLAFERMNKEFKALSEAYEEQRQKISAGWIVTGKEEILAQHAPAIARAGANWTAPRGYQASDQQREDQQQGGAAPAPEFAQPLSSEEFNERVAAFEDFKEKEARRQQEIAERQKEQAERDAARKPLSVNAPVREQPAPPPSDLQRIKYWHQIYAAKIAGFKGAVDKLTTIDRSRRSKELLALCGQISTETPKLIVSHKLSDAFRSSSKTIDPALEAFVLAFVDLAAACFASDLKQVEVDYRRGTEALNRFAEVLGPYGLKP